MSLEPAEPRTIATAIAAFSVVTIGVLSGLYLVNRAPTTVSLDDGGTAEVCPTRFWIEWDGGTPEGELRCLWTTALVSDQSLGSVPESDGGVRVLPSPLEAYGACSDAGPQYAYARVCMAMQADGGPSNEDPLPAMPNGILALETAQMQEPYDGGPMFIAVLEGEAEWPCACSRGVDCEWRPWYSGGTWLEAPLNMTLSEGQWRGSGCFRKACSELSSEFSSWPAQCPTE